MEPSSKIRIKIGDFEFEAEGPAEDVTAQFEAWRAMIAGLSPGKSSSSDRKPLLKSEKDAAPARLTPFGEPGDDDGAYLDIFAVDDKRKLVTLRAHPTGDNRDSEALLLLVYGFKRLMAMDEALVGKLKLALQTSGIQVGRIDRAISKYVGSYLLKTGSGKGGKYRLTNTGLAKATELAQEMWATFAK